MRINAVMERLLLEHKPKDVALALHVSPAMVSTWKNADNDFTPRKEVAARIQGVYGITVWPYSSLALTGIWDSLKK